jgi:Protein kinase domain
MERVTVGTYLQVYSLPKKYAAEYVRPNGERTIITTGEWASTIAKKKATISVHEEPLGTGGVGSVWKARDTRLLVAIKVLPADKIAEAGRKQRFVQEAQAASALNHPNIVTIHDISVADGVDYMVMEYVSGLVWVEHIPTGAA